MTYDPLLEILNANPADRDGETLLAIQTADGGSRMATVGRRKDALRQGFTLIETAIGMCIAAVGFLGAWTMALQAGKLVSAAEEESLAVSGLEQRIDQLRELEWPQLTDGTGITGHIYTARPAITSGLPVTAESITISPYALPVARTLLASWNEGEVPSVSFGAGAQDLSADSSVKVVASISWIGRRSARPQQRSLITLISRGGISKSDRP